MLNTATPSPVLSEQIKELERIIKKNGPDEHEYSLLDLLMQNPTDAMLLAIQENKLLEKCSFLHDRKSIMGHIRSKPYGYAGDFHIIDRIYCNAPTDLQYVKWDKYSLQTSAAKAVRNRKQYFQRFMLQKINAQPGLKLLNIASGPARDLKELYEQLENPSLLTTTCIEMDEQAISYATELTKRFEEQITFVKKNIFRYDSTDKYDVIWSAGLFDYFNDKAFVAVLSRMKNWLKSGGEIVIGNFNERNNPSRQYMELFGDWVLIHRTEDEMIELAVKAGFDRHKVEVRREPENVNLFLHITA